NWQTLEQAASRGRAAPNPNPFGLPTGFNPSVVTAFKLPTAQAEDYIAKATELRRDGDTVTGTLTADVASELLAPPRPFPGRRPRGARRPQGGAGAPGAGRRDGGGNPFDAPIQDPKGSVTFRIEDGVLTQFTLTLSGSRTIFGNELKLDRTTTTTIADIGSTKVDVPEDAREIVEALIAGVKPKVFVPEPG